MRKGVGRARYWPLLLLLAVGLLVPGCAKKEATPEPAAKTLSLVIDAEANRKDEAEAIAANLREIGVQAEVRVWEWSALKEKILAGERQMYLTDWGSAYFDPFDLAVPKLKTKDRGNYSFYSNPEFDACMDKALTSIDQAARKEAYFKAQDILYQDVPWVFGYFREEVEAASANVENWGPSMDSRINLHDVTLKDGDTIVVGMKTNKIVSLDPKARRIGLSLKEAIKELEGHGWYSSERNNGYGGNSGNGVTIGEVAGDLSSLLKAGSEKTSSDKGNQ